MGQAYSGTDGNVLSGTTDANVTGWSADVETAEADVTTTADGGWENSIGTVKKVSGTFDFFFDATLSPFGTSLNLTPGSITTLHLKCGGGDELTGSSLITKVTIKSAVKEAISGTCAFRNRGPWTLPA